MLLERFGKKVNEIARLLGYQSTVSADNWEWSTKLTRADRYDEVSISYRKSEGRIVVYGSLPRAKDGWYYDGTVSITVSADKAAAVIAKEMERRFLPQYHKRLREVIALIGDHNAMIDQNIADVSLVAARIDEPPTYLSGKSTGSGRAHSYDLGYDADEFYGGNCKVTIRCSVQTALILADVCKAQKG